MLILVSVSTSACARSEQSNLAQGDIQVLQKIYDQSSWIFRNSDVDIQVYEGGAIKIYIEGKAIEKVAGSKEAIWVPLVLFKELPDSYKLGTSSAGNTELLTYKVKEGLWSIVAEIDTTLNDEELINQTSTQAREIPVKLDVLMISPAFTEKLPLQIPVGQGRASVEASILLPEKSKFTSLSIASNGRTVEQVAKLSVLPSSLSKGQVKASTNLQPEPSTSWDFSNVTYKLPNHELNKVLIIIFGIILISIFGVIAYWIGWEIQWRSKFKRRKERLNLEAERERIRSLMSKPGNLASEYRYYQLRNIEHQLDFRQEEPSKRFLFYTVTIILISIIPILVLASVAFGTPTNFLGELNMEIKATDPETGKIEFELNFIPLSSNKNNTGKSGTGKSEITIVVGNNDSTIDKLTVNPVKTSYIRKSRTETQISVPIPQNSIPSLKLLNVLADSSLGIEGIKATDSYTKALDNSQLIQLKYEISGALKVEDKNQAGWLYWFPFDEMALEIPIFFKDVVILSNLKTTKPSYFNGDITVSGINERLLKDGDDYKLTLETGSRITVPANTVISIKGKLQRSWLERNFLTFGLLVIAVLAGAVIGWIATLPQGNILAIIIQVVGVSGWLFGIRTAVFSSHPNIPSILSGRPTTIFELVFLLNCLLFTGVAFITWRYLTKKHSGVTTNSTPSKTP